MTPAASNTTMQRVWRIVIIDGNRVDLALVRRLLLQGSTRRYTFVEAATGADGVRAVLDAEAGLPDCVVLDFRLPDMDALQVLAALAGPDGLPVCPVVVLAGDVVHEVAQEALRAGAQDYVGKGWTTAESLIRAVENAAERWSMSRDLRASERRERERAEELETVMRSVPAAIWIASDPDCHRITGNPESYRLLRAHEGDNISATATDEDPARRPFQEYHDGEPVAPDALPMQVAVRTGTEVKDSELTFVFADGAVRHVLGNASPLRDSNGKVRGGVAAYVDITALKEAEAALKTRERELQALADNSPDLLARFDGELRHVFVNAAVAQATGLPAAGFLGRTNRELGMPAPLCDCWEDGLRSVFTGGEPRLVEFAFDGPRGRRDYVARVVAERGATGAIEHVLSATYDVTERKAAEEALRAADRQKNEFLATLAHELRNPLAPLRNGLELLAHARDDAAARVREMMDRQLSQMVRLIDDLLDVSRIASGKVVLRKERVTVQAAVELAIESCRTLVESAGHALVLDMPGEPVWVEADRARLAQVIGNLLTNAAKYTPEGGRVTVAVRREGAEATIRVIDTGLGIPREMLAEVFEMFAQVNRDLDRSQGGLGIGLALVRRLLEMHGGTIVAESDGPGCGSTFTVRLPALSGEPAFTAEAPVEAPPRSMTRLRVLVVDDNQDGAETLSMLLELAGHTSRTAFSGPEALTAARELLPEVVFLDIGLPGMNGYEVARQLRAEPGREPPVLVALTGWGSEEDKRRTKDAGFDYHLTKPVEPAAVEEVLARCAARDRGKWSEAKGA